PGEPRFLREQRMRIYMDGSGTFQVAQGRDRLFSVVVALVIPASGEADLFYRFLRLRDQWGISSVEIKGRELDETQISQVIARFSGCLAGVLGDRYGLAHRHRFDGLQR